MTKTSRDRAGCEGERLLRRRRMVIEAANALFKLKGFHGAGIAEVAKNSGIAVGQVYRDFSSKEEIMFEVIETCALQVDEQSLAHAVSANDEEYVIKWISRVLTRYDNPLNTDLLSEIIAEASRSKRLKVFLIDKRLDMHRSICMALQVFSPGTDNLDRRTRLADAIMAMSFGLWQDREIRGVMSTDLKFFFDQIIQREIADLKNEKLGASVKTSDPSIA